MLKAGKSKIILSEKRLKKCAGLREISVDIKGLHNV